MELKYNGVPIETLNSVMELFYNHSIKAPRFQKGYLCYYKEGEKPFAKLSKKGDIILDTNFFEGNDMMGLVESILESTIKKDGENVIEMTPKQLARRRKVINTIKKELPLAMESAKGILESQVGVNPEDIKGIRGKK